MSMKTEFAVSLNITLYHGYQDISTASFLPVSDRATSRAIE